MGNVLGGKAADRALHRSLLVILFLLTLVLVGFALTAQSTSATPIALVLMGPPGSPRPPACSCGS